MRLNGDIIEKSLFGYGYEARIVTRLRLRPSAYREEEFKFDDYN